MNSFKLDRWDNLFISYFKRAQQPDVEGCKKIWAERCAVDVSICQASSIGSYLTRLFNNITTSNPELLDSWNYLGMQTLIEDLDPNKYSWFGGPKNNTFNYWEHVIRVLGSRLRLLEIKYLEPIGYVLNKKFDNN